MGPIFNKMFGADVVPIVFFDRCARLQRVCLRNKTNYLCLWTETSVQQRYALTPSVFLPLWLMNDPISNLSFGKLGFFLWKTSQKMFDCRLIHGSNFGVNLVN